ncbi:hypothetical protein VN12_23670 [Pirellula sp. SH-Sr6A]|uniref:PDZ domain-containing protein n=1 Tax=Pirellula sp. SH-Sr6A TaxID=1632865 RepID=UPI00078ED52B|nr:PDZ domain-containing protein [Pirellula sp. SH-Sr6A]AMV35145.1 hypothetical protein VN12_23670 [Pirellula sp. SH-Sr6A]
MNRSTRRFRTCLTAAFCSDGGRHRLLQWGVFHLAAGCFLTAPVSCWAQSPSDPPASVSAIEGESSEGPSETEILGWIENLSDKSYGKREWASDQLYRHADAAFPMIEKSLKKADGEAFTRMLEIVCDLIRSSHPPRKSQATALIKRLANETTGSRGLQAARVHEAVRLQVGQSAWARVQRLSPEMRLSFPSRSQLLQVNDPLDINESFQGTAEDLQDLDHVDWIRFARLEGSKITPEILKAVLRLPNLNHLQIVDAKLTAEDLLAIKDGPELNILELSYVPVGDELIPHLREFPVTQTLWIFGTNMSLDGGRQALDQLSDIELFVSRGAYLGVLSQANSLVIDRVIENSAAARAGLRYRDQIMKVNDVELKSFDDLRRELRKFAPGESAEIEFKRLVPSEPRLRDPLDPGPFRLPTDLDYKPEIMKATVTFGKQSI